MSSQLVPIQRTNADSTGGISSHKNDVWFDAFNFTAGQDQNIRWLSRPNQQHVHEKYENHDPEKFRITFDVENFQPDQIKVYIQNRKLTISGVYEERSEGRFMQKQFEKSFDIPATADVESMAAYITSAHMLVAEIPLDPNRQHIDHLAVDKSALNDQRRVSFSLSKFNTSNGQGLLGSNNLATLPPPGSQVRRTSITKTTTTTTSSGSGGIPAEASELLRNVDSSTGGSSSHSTHTTERRSSTTGSQPIIINEPVASSNNETTTSSTLTSSDLTHLPIEIPPELLASGGTITIQKRKVSVTKTADTGAAHPVSVPTTTTGNELHSKSSTTTSNSSNNTTTNTSNQPQHHSDANQQLQQSNSTTNRRGSQTMSSSNQRRMFTLEEFLQNKTWNPTIADGPDGKKILYMRLQMKPGTKVNQLKISLNGHDLRVEVDNKVSNDTGLNTSEHSYRQVTLFPTCDVNQLKTEFKDDGFLHIQVPIQL